MNLRRPGQGVQKSVFALQPALVSDREVLDQDAFHRMISLERKRTERSGKPFLLMLVDAGQKEGKLSQSAGLHRAALALLQTTRETDVLGWYKRDAVLGAMYTELGAGERNAIMSAMFLRVNETLQEHLAAEQFEEINISFHVFPEEWDSRNPELPSNPKLYPDLKRRNEAQKLRHVVKRMIDVLGSLAVLVLGSPIFFLIAAVIKLSSKGPVFYRQQRVGQHGRSFSFIKFRSMHHGNDCSIHKKYVQELIAGVAEKHSSDGNGKAVYKLTHDPRVTRVGAFLRRSSLDELPQFINVLKGDMSLVGPRPPIGYEVEKYELWHRRRVLEAKPGITGLWQVSGRNRIGFDEMVRLDLRYAKSWSPWTDLKILFQTPKAMIEGAH